jgi:hypothetical protein
MWGRWSASWPHSRLLRSWSCWSLDGCCGERGNAAAVCSSERRWRSAALVLGIFFAVAFDTAFASFHALFFRQGTWQFGPDSNLIRLFPEPFWFETSLLAGLSIVLSAALAAWLARRGINSGSAER